MLIPATVSLIKATLIFLIFSAFHPLRWLRILCWIGLGVTFVFYTASIIVQVIPCHPRGGTDRVASLAGVANLQCAGWTAMVQRMNIATGVFGLISDLYILMIPLPAVAWLHLETKKELGVYLIFSSGALESE
jgi:hypothetical protein